MKMSVQANDWVRIQKQNANVFDLDARTGSCLIWKHIKLSSYLLSLNWLSKLCYLSMINHWHYSIREPFLAHIQLLNHKLVAESRCLRNAINKLESTCRSFFPLECSNMLIEQFQVTKFCNQVLFRKSMSKVVLNLL